jgi:hypothetical protein
MQLRYLKSCELQDATKTQQDNGSFITTYSSVGTYCVEVKELSGMVEATLYGADIDKMLYIYSLRQELETFLLTKENNSSDNISDYYICLNSSRYKIVGLKSDRVTIKRLEAC